MNQPVGEPNIAIMEHTSSGRVNTGDDIVPSTTVVIFIIFFQRSPTDLTLSQMALISTTSHFGFDGVSIQTIML
jgi:hypothetical protein